MKRINNPILVSLLFSLIVLATSCYSQKKSSKSKSKSSTTTETKKSTLTETKTSTENKTSQEPANTEASTGSSDGNLKNHAPEIQKTIKNENGVIRGYDFGTTKQKIKETEDAEFVSDGKDFMIYNVKLNDKEKAKIIYYLDENDKVKGFGIAFLVNAALMSENIEATLVDDFQNYFTERYGSFKANDKGDDVWTAKDGSYTIEMGDSSDEGSSNVEIEIEIFQKK